MATFGEELRRLRLNAGKTLADVAAVIGKSGVTIPYVSDIERGRRNPPSSEDIGRILRLLDSLDKLDRMLDLAAAFRGSVEISAIDSQSRRVLVALERKLADEGLSEEDVRRLIEVLAERRTK